MSDRTGERCDWCERGTFERIGVNYPYFRNLEEVIYKCTECHHEIAGYEVHEEENDES